ncbi:MAG: polymer-forming cytoskeletal protein [Calditrichaeota bacterium]|nr:polymer-forming cytoskeletal protein [Calditrichota bacterium]MCB9391612.1 polymer-forming cytoskeletal protein [Calditrichota bacterium]
MAKWTRLSSSESSSGELSTLIAKDAEFQGTLKTQGSLRIDGRIVGDVVCTKSITVGPTGVIEGNVVAENVVLAGRVKGSMVAKQRIHLEATAELEGDLKSARLSVQEGAKIHGHTVTETDRVPSAKPPLPEVQLSDPNGMVPRNRPVNVA